MVPFIHAVNICELYIVLATGNAKVRRTWLLPQGALAEWGGQIAPDCDGSW